MAFLCTQKILQNDLSQVEAALLDDPAVDDCVVLARQAETSGIELVVYVVTSGPLSPQLQSRLQALLPEDLPPSVYVPVSTLPLTLEGEVDEQALARMEVIDTELLQRWSDRSAQLLPEGDQVAVVVQEEAEHMPPLHISELLPSGQAQAAIALEESIISPVRQAEDQEASGDPQSATNWCLEPRALAISDGGPLTIEEDAPKTLTDALIRTATKYKDKGILYIQTDGSEVSQTYGLLLSEAKCILTGLYRMGLKPYDTAILQIEALSDYFPTFWACILGGITPVTVAVAPTYDHKNSVVSKLFNTWELLHAPILASDSLIESLSGLSSFLPMKHLKVLSVSELRNHPPASQIHQSYPHEVAFFQLTSGSTGVPKCIQETHNAIISHIHASKEFNDYHSEDISLNWLTVDHVVPLLTFHLKDVYLGCQQIQAPTDMILGNPLKWFDLIQKYRITHTWSPNFGYKLVSEHLSKVHDNTWDLSSIKFFMNAGEQVTLPVVRDFLKLVAPFDVPSHAMQPAFGMAEVCTCIVYQNHFDFETGVHQFQKSSLNSRLRKAERDAETVSFIDLGPPVQGVQIRIVDRENQLLLEGVIGRLQIRGDVVTPGYFNNQAANQEAFVGDGWFNTGDLGFILDGRLTITGREKEIVIIHGVNYYCYEIEDILNGIEGIEPTYVAACAIDDTGTGTEALAIFFTPVVETLKQQVNLIKAIQTKVASALGISPAYVIPVARSEFPKTTSGKMQRAKLKQLLAAGHFQNILKEIDIYLENANTLPDWFYRKIWRRKEVRTYTPQLRTGPYLVFLDRLGLGAFLCAELDRLSQTCVRVEAGLDFRKLATNFYCLDPKNPDHYRRLLKSLEEDQIRVNQILHLWTYDQFAGIVSSLEALDQAQDQGVYSLLFLVQALAQSQAARDPVRLLVVSSYAQATSPGDEIAYEKTPVLGLLKTIPQEMPWLCRHIDLHLEPTQVNAAYIVRELRAVKGDRETAYRNGQRLVPRLEKVVLRTGVVKQKLPFRRGGMYLISGGLGGIGVEIAKYLLQHNDARLLLVGRNPLPQRSEWEFHLEQEDAISYRIKAYLALEQLGGEISYEAVDICDGARLQQVVDQAQSRWQCRLDGVIHLAGVFQERLLVDETRESAAKTLRSKVLGTWVLHQLIKDQPQAVFISSSSVNGFLGGAMVGAYAAANSFLDSFSQYQRYQHSLRSYCFSWSLWDEVGMSRGYQMKDLSRARGYQLIAAEQGLNSLLVGLYHEQAHLLVGLDGGNRYIRQHTETKSYRVQKLSAYFTAQSDQVSLKKLQELVVPDRFGVPSTCDFVSENRGVSRATTERVSPQTELERRLTGIWKEVLGVQVGIYDNFLELGGDSLRATQIVSQLREVFSLDLPLRSFLLECSSIAKLAEVVEEMLIEKLEGLPE